ncbi:UPF0764 protein C16orf89 homolog isoform X2 [Leptopilina heterotoma]|nr:UPF0764 protein C16orf89 homolog isoform X2 [Leptopilina heterotoma]
MNFQLTRILTFCAMCINVSLSNKIQTIHSQELDKLLKALKKVVDFMAARPEELNLDAAYGLTLGEAHLMSASSHHNMRLLTLEQEENLKSLLNECSKTRTKIKRLISAKSGSDSYYMESLPANHVLMEPKYWSHPVNWKSDNFKSTAPKNLHKNDFIIQKLIWHGKPDENESDKCIIGILKEFQNNTCEIADDCEAMLLEDDDPQGYSTTHRLLLLMIAKAFNCKELKTVSSDELVPKYCSSILQNLKSLDALGFPSTSLDLAMEEVLLCGTQGYLEFLHNQWLNNILSWQKPSGCYDAFSKKYKHKSRKRRYSNKIDFGCEDHTTGLGVGSIALFIRHYIENNIDKVPN